MERAMDILFGGGRWTCAGKMVALAELSKTAFEVRVPVLFGSVGEKHRRLTRTLIPS
jgi:hypothetical protein